MSKAIVEFIGTAMIGVFYILEGNRQVGFLFGFWILTLFGFGISGSHYNPAITLSLMLRKDSPFGEGTNHRLLGVLFIIA
jgi:glycerol uptake facilitator-like aquaporin|tara:strand:+ start:171 stop:410 length:240 start_codon:yes stop_codon:yes gene_type:complete